MPNPAADNAATVIDDATGPSITKRLPLRRTWSSGSHAGARQEPRRSRGVLARAGPAASAWRESVEAIIGYAFQDGDILEEALESPGSGVTCVGESHRHFTDGNRGLAAVGMSVMELDLRDQAYLYKIPPAEGWEMIGKLLSQSRMAKVGKTSKIESFIRPTKRTSRSTKGRVLNALKDGGEEDTSKTISRAIAAIVGAAYYDGGLKAAHKVLASLGIEIRAPS